MNQSITAHYTVNEEVKEVLFTKEEIVKFGLKNVIRFHANKLHLKNYKCNVVFPDKKETFAEKRERICTYFKATMLINSVHFRSVNKLLEVRRMLSA